jgi:amino acid adenylation domain-containing protein
MPDLPVTQIPLTAAQRGLWAAQLTIGDVPIAVSQCIHLHGPLDAGAAIRSMQRAYRELLVGIGPVVVTPDGPRMMLVDNDFAIENIDLRQRPDPVAAAHDWMDAAGGRTMSLDTGDLLVTALLRVADERWLLFTRAHHILLDGYGALNLMRRGAAHYRPPADGERGTPQPDGDAASLDVLVQAEQAYRESPRYCRDQEYWQQQHRDLPEPVVLGSVRAAPSARPVRVGRAADEPLTAAIAERCAELTAHESAVLIAGIGAFVARIADRDRVVVSLPVPARVSAATRSVAGSSSNLVPLVISAPPQTSLREFVRSVSTSIAGALRHQCYRHEDMLRDSGAALTSLHQFGPVINLFPTLPSIEFGSVTANYEVLSTGPVVDLNINVYPGDHGGGQRIDMEANPESFSAATVSTLHAELMSFLSSFAELPADGLIDDVVLDAAPLDGEDPPPDAPAPVTMADLLAQAPVDDRPAVIDREVRLTYRELDTRATRLADVLRIAGAGPESAVATLLPRSADSVVAAWAIARTGACYVPIDPRYPPARIDAILSAAGCRIGVAHIPPPASPVRWISPTSPPSTGANPVPAAAPMTSPDHAAYQIYTSGSTGAPKGVVVTGRGLAALATEIRRSYALESDSVIAHFASPSFDTSIVEMLAAAISGAALAVVPPDIVGGSELAAVLADRTVTHLLITPSALATLPPAGLPALRSVLAGGEACPPALARRWIASGRRFRCAYGPTETTCSVTITDALGPDAIRLRVPIGAAMPAVQALILDRRLRPQPAGAVGELFIGGPSLARGYQQAATTAHRFVANPWGPPGSRLYRTGDLVSRRPDGSLDFRGRTDDQLKLRGFRVEPGEVDAVLRGLPGVENAATVPRRRGDTTSLASYVTGRDLEPRRLRRHLAATLPTFLMPATITVLPEFPTTPTGKIDRSRLPIPEVASTTPYRAPTTPLEKHCQQVFSEVTGASTIGLDDDFFAIGGDSLSAIELVARLNAATAGSLVVRDIIDARTPAGIAAMLAAAELPPIVPAGARPTPLAPAQHNVDLADRSAAHVIPFAVTVPTVDFAALAAALADVAGVHQLLRATLADGLMRPDTAPALRLEPFTGDARDFAHRGFDLTRDPPVRVGVRQDDEQVTVAVALHHAAIDGRSLAILAADLATAYLARSAGREPHLPTPEVDYLDYARWINEWLGDPADPESRYAAQIAYWRGELSGLPAAFPSPAPRPRPAPWDRCGDRRTYSLADVWSRLEAIAHDCGTTAFAAARGSIARRLSVAAGATDIVIGTPVAGRPRSECDRMVGMFVNTLPLRYRMGPTDSVADVVAGHVDVERRAHRHSDVGYVDIATALGHADADVHPLFQIVVSSDDGGSLPSMPGIAAVEPLAPAIAKCDLHFSIRPPHGDEPATVEVLYPAAMFEAADIDHLVDGWLRSV